MDAGGAERRVIRRRSAPRVSSGVYRRLPITSRRRCAIKNCGFRVWGWFLRSRLEASFQRRVDDAERRGRKEADETRAHAAEFATEIERLCGKLEKFSTNQ